MSQTLVAPTDGGLYCPPGDFFIDPWRPVDRAVITHAHADHARPGSARYLCALPGRHILQNRLGPVFRAILDGCAALPVQVVLSLGGREATWDGPPPANAVVVPFAPQLKLLERAAVLVTHAGLNTALEGLARGLPMLCLPVTNDQPGVARRVEWLGAGEVLKPGRATAGRVRESVGRLLADGRYRAAAERCRDLLKANPGVARAADIVEEALRTGHRVER